MRQDKSCVSAQGGPILSDAQRAGKTVPTRLHAGESSATQGSSGKAFLSSGKQQMAEVLPPFPSHNVLRLPYKTQKPCLQCGARHAHSSTTLQHTAACLTHLEAGLQHPLHGSTLPGWSAPRHRVLSAQRRSLRLGHSSSASSRAGCPLLPSAGICPGLPAAATPPRLGDTSTAQPEGGVPLPAVQGRALGAMPPAREAARLAACGGRELKAVLVICMLNPSLLLIPEVRAGPLPQTRRWSPLSKW